MPRSIRTSHLWASILSFLAALVTAVPATADVPPLNGNLIFARSGGVLTVGTEALVGSAKPVRVVSGFAATRDPAWSQDALRIAFSGRRARNLDIWMVGSHGAGGPRRLTKDGAADTDPDWSPGGEKIAFTSRRDGNAEIYVMTSTGAGQVRLAPSPGTDRQPVWSPDGTKIAFASDRGGSLAIWTMNADGSDLAALTPGGRYATDPAWSPDGSRIAYASGSRGATSIVSVDSRGADRRPVTSGGEGDRFPAWSPDGQQIAFSRANRMLVADVRATSGSRFGSLRSVARGRNPDWAVLPLASNAPPPEEGETANAMPGKGEVSVRLPGALVSAPLDSARQIPVDTRFNTTAGQVTLVLPGGDGEATEAVASRGRFTYTETDPMESDPVSILDLPQPDCVPGNEASTRNSVALAVEGPTTKPGRRARGRAARRPGRRVGTRGRVRGRRVRAVGKATAWTTTVGCDRIIFAVREGVVQVQDSTTGDEEVEVPADYCYIAPGSVPFVRRDCE